MAMPAWAYYYQQVFNDKSLNIDPGAAFIPPASMQNEIIFDYNQAVDAQELLPVEGEDGNKSGEYIEIPISTGKEKVVTESQKFEDPSTPREAAKPSPAPVKENIKPTKDSVERKRGGFLKRVFGKKQ